MKTLLPKVFLLFILVFLTSKDIIFPVFSVSPAHIVINEIQIAGNTATDEFVELYNQTENPISLTNWMLKRAVSQTKYTLATLTGTIPAHGYFLIVGPNYDGSTAFDIKYASSIGNNNTLYLMDNSSLIIDKVGIGNPYESENSPAPEPLANTSIERINHQDTDNNAVDFVINNSPDPQNSLSPIDPPFVSPSPTIEPSLIPSPSPSLEPTIEPSPTVNPSIEPSPSIIPSSSPEISPSPTVEPTLNPSPSPTASVSPSPTLIPTPSPTIEPSLTPNPTITPSPSISPFPTVSPTPTPSDRILFNQFGIMCKLQYFQKKISWLIFYIPKLTCTTYQ